MPQTWQRNNCSFFISSDATLLNADHVYNLLSEHAWWYVNVPKAMTEKALANSLCVGLYLRGAEHKNTSGLDPLLAPGKLVGFARWVTDQATFGYLMDVVIHQDHRGNGLGKWLVKCCMELEEMNGVYHDDYPITPQHSGRSQEHRGTIVAPIRRLMLATSDAVQFYEKIGDWKESVQGDGVNLMEIRRKPV